MKKVLLAVALIISYATTYAASTNTIDVKAINNFRFDFKNAANASWVTTKYYYQVTFNLNGKQTAAYYNFDGELFGTSNTITLEELPTNAKRVFAKKYNGFIVKEAHVFKGTDETAYYISATKDNESLIVKVSEAGQVSLFKKL